MMKTHLNMMKIIINVYLILDMVVEYHIVKTLIESNGVLLPTNNVSVKNSPYVTFASQYPLNDKESLKHYFNMLFDNDIKTVYVLASNKDIKWDFSKP